MHRSIARWPGYTLALVPCLAVALLLAPAAWADEGGYAPAGKDVASAWCANCHAFPGSKQATATGAPSFAAVAADRAMTPDKLRAFLRTSHNRMPDLHLSNQELDDLIAFIRSLRHR